MSLQEPDYIEPYRAMLCKGYTKEEVLDQVKDYRARLDKLPNVLPGLDDARRQAEQFINTLTKGEQ